jgi:ferredoxin-NADP reductase
MDNPSAIKPKYPLPKKYLATVSGNKYLNKSVIRLDLKLKEPDTIDFLPGQFISIKVGEGTFRAYSVCSDAEIKDRLSLVIAVSHEGVGSCYVRGLKIDDQLEFIGPSGRYVLPETLTKNLVFISTGTGLAPQVAMLHRLPSIKYRGNITLYQGFRNNEESMLIEELDSFTHKLKHFKYYLCLSKQDLENNTNPRILPGRVNINISLDQTKETQYFICGNPNMVKEVTELLLSIGIPQNAIFYEHFTASTPKTSN